MAANPLVSIITTYYNSVQLGGFVKSSMECLLNQTYRNIEFICVNDGSTDSTLQELEEFAKIDSRIRIYTKENQKYAQYSKAYGQEKSSGEFIFLFDHDDTIDLETIQKCLQAFATDPSLDIVAPIVDTKFTNGKPKYTANLDHYINNISDYSLRKISGKEAIEKTVGRYDIHIRGLYKSHVFKSHSFQFSEPLLNADEIVERLIFENAKYIGTCNAVYTHYIHPDSSAKLPSPKIIDVVRTDVILRQLFKKKRIYENRKYIFELTAYKNLVNAIKIFHLFSGKMTAEEQMSQRKRLLDSYAELDKKMVLSQYKGITKIYNTFLLSHFSALITFYQYKNK